MEKGIGREFDFKNLLYFTMPTIITMVFLSVYTIADGIFISRYVGAVALSATNIVYPVMCLVLGISIMFSTGGSAVVARLMGEGKKDLARQIFTALTILVFFIGIIILVFGLLFLKPIIYFLGSTEELYIDCKDYLLYTVLFVPTSILKPYIDTFFVTAGRPKLGLISGVLGGAINISLDYYFIVILDFGVKGAAIATALGMLIPCILGFYYFFTRKEDLYFVAPTIRMKTVIEVCINGSSEMVTQSASGISTFLFNLLLLKYEGVDGVAAITIILYAQFLMSSVFLGFISGLAPILSFHYGSGNKVQLHRLVGYGNRTIACFSVLVFLLAVAIAPELTRIFTPAHTPLFSMTVHGFRLFAIAFLFQGFNIYFTGMFTAFSNGKISALISFLRTMAFFVPGIFILSYFFGVTGIWITVPMAEFLTILFCYYVQRKYRSRYGY